MIKLTRTDKKNDKITLIHKPKNHPNTTKKESFLAKRKNQVLLILSIFWITVLSTLLNSLSSSSSNQKVIPILDEKANTLKQLKKNLVREHNPSNVKRMTSEEREYNFARDRYGIVGPDPDVKKKKDAADEKSRTATNSNVTNNNIDQSLINWIKKQEGYTYPPNALRAVPAVKVDEEYNNINRNYCKCVDCDEDKLCGGLWRGNLVTTPPKILNNVTVSIVLSHCDKPLDWVDEFLGKVPIANFTIISKCNQEVKNAPNNSVILRLPNVGRCDHSYIYYMARYKKEAIDSNKNHIHLFLKDTRFIHQDGDLRTLKEMINIAYVNGFACGLTSPYQMSIYHKTSVLKRFSMDMHRNTPDQKKFKSRFKNMGAWVDSMNISRYIPDPYTPVCYSGIFAVQTNRFVQYERSFWDRLEKSLSRGNSIEEGHFMERAWSSLFSNRLKKYEIIGISDYMETYNGACCYNGALMHDIYDDL